MPINKNELFDTDVLENLLRHEGINQTEKAVLRRYKKLKVNGNQVNISYDFPESVRSFAKGRIYPQPFLGLATFPKEIRAALASKYYTEVDMVNSQPTLLVQIAEREGVVCDSLRQYVEKRDEVLEAIQKTHKLTRSEAKDICIATLYGGFRDQHPLLPGIQKELTTLASVIVNKYPDFLQIARKSKETKKRDDNLNAGALAHYAQDTETRIFLKVAEFLESKGWSVDVLQHDGGDVRKKDGEEVPMSLLTEAQGYVLETMGFSIKLGVKPLDHSFDFNAASASVIVPQNILINDSFAAEHFVSMVGDRLRLVGTELYAQDADGMWDSGDFQIRKLIDEFSKKLVWKQYNTMGMLLPHDYGGSVNNISKLITQTYMKAKPGHLPLSFAFQNTDSCEDSGEVAMFLELVSLVSGKVPSLSDYLQKWLAHILQKPYELPGVMLILTGEKGVGKDTLFDFFMEFVLGKTLSENYGDNRQFFDKYDEGRKGKLLVKLEEADRKACMERSSELKAMVTGRDASFNPKMQRKVTLPNYNRLVFTTNKGNPVDFGGGERRFVILPCSNEKKGNRAYWASVRKTLFTEKGGKVIADYLMSLDLSGFDVGSIPENEYQDAVVDTELTPEERFIADWDGEKANASEFFHKYQTYCQDNDLYYATNMTAFGRILLPFIRDGKVLKGRGSQGAWYKKPE